MNNIEETKEQELIAEKIEEEDIYEEFTTNDDGTFEEVYRDKRTGNIVTPPHLRSPLGRQVDPRRQVCWDSYVKSIRAGNPNAREAARIAGYSPNTCLNITNQKWFKELKSTLRRSKMKSNAERNIARLLNLGLTRLKILEDGSTEEVFDAEKARIVADMSKLIVTTLGKDDGWSTKTELKVTTLPTPILEIDSIDNIPQLEENNEVIE